MDPATADSLSKIARVTVANSTSEESIHTIQNYLTQ